jgi:hypothetical protein
MRDFVPQCLLDQTLQLFAIANHSLVRTLEYCDSVGQMEAFGNAAVPQWVSFIQTEQSTTRRDAASLELPQRWLIFNDYRHVLHAASETRWNPPKRCFNELVKIRGLHGLAFTAKIVTSLFLDERPKRVPARTLPARFEFEMPTAARMLQ